MSDLKVNILF